MANYLYVDNYAQGGSLGISNFAFSQLAGRAIQRVVNEHKDAKLTLDKPIASHIHNNQLTITLNVKMSKDSDVKQVSEDLHAHSARLITTMADIVPFAVNVKITSLV